MPIIECWVGKTLSKAEWDALAAGIVTERWAAYRGYVELEAEFSPARPAGPTVVDLGEGEVVHHETTVSLSELAIPGDLHDEAQLVLTNSRLVIFHQAAVFDIRLADIEKVEPSFPGFIIKTRGTRYPLYCFPAPGDPVYHAIVTALKRIH
ncbi:MAG: hypothetical protein HYY30_09155 [Chloroflexi bacterium]|nr:hypothetical protein [Chloroflexota bacterium]